MDGAERWSNGWEAPRRPVNARRWDQEMFGMSYRTSANSPVELGCLMSIGMRHKSRVKKAAAIEPRLIDVPQPHASSLLREPVKHLVLAGHRRDATRAFYTAGSSGTGEGSCAK